MRVLWVSHSAEIGGAELCLVEGVPALAERGHKVSVVLPKEGPLRHRLASAASVHVCWYNPWATTFPVPLRDRIRWMTYNALIASREIARIAQATGAQVVVSNTLVSAAGALGAKRAGLPHIWFIHEFGPEDQGLRFHFGRRASVGFMKLQTDLFLVNSTALRAHFAQWIPEDKLRRVHYAIDIPREMPVNDRDEKTFRLVLVGVRRPSKGQQDAVAAVELLIAAGLDVQLDLIGNGEPDFDRQLRDRATRSGIDHRVHLVDLPPRGHFERFSNTDAALMCSRSEAFGRVTVEAMKLGKPVVGAAAGATPELVRPGWNGMSLASWSQKL